jgi:hypothetical protein
VDAKTIQLDAKHFLLSHAIWVAIVAVGVFAGHAWLVEHDQRLLADKQEKISEAQVKDLQAQIAQLNAAAAKQVQVITKIVHDVQTPQQAVATIPQITAAPLAPEVIPSEPTKVAVDAVPLVAALGQCKIDAVNLQACAEGSQKKDEIIAEKDKEIAAIKKPKNFWHRLTGTLKSVGIGVGIGVALGARL